MLTRTEYVKFQEMVAWYNLQRQPGKVTVPTFEDWRQTVKVTDYDFDTGYFTWFGTRLRGTSLEVPENPDAGSPESNPLIERNGSIPDISLLPFFARINRRGEHSTLGTLWEFDLNCCLSTTGTGTGDAPITVDCCDAPVSRKLNIDLRQTSGTAWLGPFNSIPVTYSGSTWSGSSSTLLTVSLSCSEDDWSLSVTLTSGGETGTVTTSSFNFNSCEPFFLQVEGTFSTSGAHNGSAYEIFIYE